RHYDAGTGLRSLDDLHDVVAFFEARRGSLHAFRFRDPFDMKSCRPQETPLPSDQPLGLGDAAPARFALVKVYGIGVEAQRRFIKKPVEGSLRIAVAGIEKASGTDFTFDPAAGEIVFASGAIPGPGEAVTAGYAFDVPVRFDTDRL